MILQWKKIQSNWDPITCVGSQAKPLALYTQGEVGNVSLMFKRGMVHNMEVLRDWYSGTQQGRAWWKAAWGQCTTGQVALYKMQPDVHGYLQQCNLLCIGMHRSSRHSAWVSFAKGTAALQSAQLHCGT